LDISGNNNHGVISGPVPATYPLLSGVELVANGGMESGNPPTGWSADACAIASDAVIYYGGAKSCKITLDASNGAGGAIQNITGLTIGKQYKVSTWLRGVDLVGNTFRIWFAEGTVNTLAISNGSWVYLEGFATATATSHLLEIYTVANANKIFNIDDVSVQEVVGYESIGWDEDGVDDRYVIVDSASLRMGTNKFAVLTWVRPEYGGTNQAIHTLFSKATGGRYELAIEDCTADPATAPLLYGYVHDGIDGTDGVISVTPISMNRWHLLGMLVDRVANKMYGILDGVLDHAGVDISSVTGNISPTGTLYVNYSNGQGHKGARGDFIIFNPLYSETEIRNYYELTRHIYEV
jgi:hypothetical protein